MFLVLRGAVPHRAFIVSDAKVLCGDMGVGEDIQFH